MATITNIVILTVALVAVCGMQCIHAKTLKGKSSLDLCVKILTKSLYRWNTLKQF